MKMPTFAVGLAVKVGGGSVSVGFWLSSVACTCGAFGDGSGPTVAIALGSESKPVRRGPSRSAVGAAEEQAVRRTAASKMLEYLLVKDIELIMPVIVSRPGRYQTQSRWAIHRLYVANPVLVLARKKRGWVKLKTNY